MLPKEIFNLTDGKEVINELETERSQKMSKKIPNRALNPQIEKLRGSTGSHVVLYFIHRSGACLERRGLNDE